MSKGKILVTPRSMTGGEIHPALKKLEEKGYEIFSPFVGRRPSEEELIEVVTECVGYIAGVEIISGKVLRNAKKLRVISRNGIGIDNVDCDTAKELGIVIKNAPGANAQGVAELAITLMFAMLRSIIPISVAVKQNEWKRIRGIEVVGRTLGIVGTGAIGRKVAKMASGLDMHICAYDLYPNEELSNTISNVRYTTLDELYVSSDVITLHCPVGDKPLIDMQALSKMKKGVYLINTARDGLVVQDDLLNALNSHQVSGYAVDAFAEEPPIITPLFEHPQVILSSHIGGYTAESIDRATVGAVENLLHALENTVE